MSKNFMGQHLVVDRGLYTHHGLGDDSGGVIHYSGLADGLQSGPISRASLEDFSQGAEIKVIAHEDRKYSPEETVSRAKHRLGENAYSVTGNNCEHFVVWCITGKHASQQVDSGVKIGTGVASGAAGTASRAAIAASGSVAGLSGSGVMSGLATVGRVSGASLATGASATVGGMAVLAGSGGLAMASLLNNSVLEDDTSLPESERDSRQLGRGATYVGAAAGTAGGIAAVSAAGTTAGLSAAGITSGLSAIGAGVGGGMAAGTAVVAAAPVAAAAAVGYGAYKLWQWISD